MDKVYACHLFFKSLGIQNHFPPNIIVSGRINLKLLVKKGNTSARVRRGSLDPLIALQGTENREQVGVLGFLTVPCGELCGQIRNP